jgi:hypothetical protein
VTHVVVVSPRDERGARLPARPAPAHVAAALAAAVEAAAQAATAEARARCALRAKAQALERPRQGTASTVGVGRGAGAAASTALTASSAGKAPAGAPSRAPPPAGPAPASGAGEGRGGRPGQEEEDDQGAAVAERYRRLAAYVLRRLAVDGMSLEGGGAAGATQRSGGAAPIYLVDDRWGGMYGMLISTYQMMTYQCHPPFQVVLISFEDAVVRRWFGGGWLWSCGQVEVGPGTAQGHHMDPPNV